MRPVLFRFRGRPLYSYPAFLYLGLVVGLTVGDIVARRVGLSAPRVYLASLVLVVPALVGARLAHVAGYAATYRDDPRRIWRRSEGGFVMYGGLPPMLAASVPLLAALGVPFFAFWDVAVFTILAGMAVARVGCLLNGCCGGRPSDGWFAVVLPDRAGVVERRIPTQGLEAALALLLLAGAGAMIAADPPDGAVFLAVAGGYGLARIGLQSLRERVGRVIPLQAASLALAVAAIAASVVVWAP